LDKLELYRVSFYISDVLDQVALDLCWREVLTRKSESVQSQKWNVIGYDSRATTHIRKEKVKGAAVDIISW